MIVNTSVVYHHLFHVPFSSAAAINLEPGLPRLLAPALGHACHRKPSLPRLFGSICALYAGTCLGNRLSWPSKLKSNFGHPWNLVSGVRACQNIHISYGSRARWMMGQWSFRIRKITCQCNKRPPSMHPKLFLLEAARTGKLLACTPMPFSVVALQLLQLYYE